MDGDSKVDASAEAIETTMRERIRDRPAERGGAGWAPGGASRQAEASGGGARRISAGAV